MPFIIAVFMTFITLTAATPAYAQTEDPILSMPDGQVILNISATERKEVEQDLLVASLSYNVTNRDSKVVQNEINTAMAKALKAAKAIDTIKVNTGSYQVHETSDERTREKLWRGQQSMTLKSMEADDVLKLAGELQDMGLNMNGLSYMLAPKTAVEVQDNLMEDALKQLQERANRAAKALGKSKADLRDVNVQSSGIPYRQVNRSHGFKMESMAADMAAPVAAAGETTIQLTVSARALLKP